MGMQGATQASLLTKFQGQSSHKKLPEHPGVFLKTCKSLCLEKLASPGRAKSKTAGVQLLKVSDSRLEFYNEPKFSVT